MGSLLSGLRRQWQRERAWWREFRRLMKQFWRGQ
jgi:hypothetical protein